ncbi:hypothetical protein DRW41_22075 [Neobacillus piezotolerans]|uniref:Uncharacterized protein n=1 Tax=Neobacillus piezotolerans TaxID=2259171 RepID=A0A3D8GJS7_9BACI|nr:hypothetical protein [Neobacillus piezotolerans]RDU34715.1 hypothetical protein DRW41_22075 [Neobacillus piezotolerans]
MNQKNSPKKYTAVAIANSEDLSMKALTNPIDLSAQKKLKKPIVVIMDNKKNLINHFWIEAKNMKDFEFMLKEKVFFTSSIPVGTYWEAYQAFFCGVPKGFYEKEKTLSCN